MNDEHNPCVICGSMINLHSVECSCDDENCPPYNFCPEHYKRYGGSFEKLLHGGSFEKLLQGDIQF